MALHKDKNGNLHDDAGGAAIAFFPSGLGPYTPVSDLEAAAIIAANTPRTTAEQVREDRDSRIAACDWTQLADAPLTSAKKTEWKTYRQALRDVPAQANFPDAVQWPVAP